MIVVDSSVWIDYFRNRSTPQVELLDNLLDRETVIAADLVVAEVLQGVGDHRPFDLALARLSLALPLTICDTAIAVQAAHHYRYLRERGVTVRKMIDVLIATRCIADNPSLLHCDRDYEPFVRHLQLRSAMDDYGVN